MMSLSVHLDIHTHIVTYSDEVGVSTLSLKEHAQGYQATEVGASDGRGVGDVSGRAEGRSGQ